MVRCADNSFYTGITRDVEKRISEHNGSVNGAKYTRGRRPVKLVYVEASESRSTASKREHVVRHLSKQEKASLALQSNTSSGH